MNYEQFCKEMQAIDGVTNIEIDKEPPVAGRFFGPYVVSFTGVGPNKEMVSACVKHIERGRAMEAIINLANHLCNQPVL
jgi:hypothetical protein